MPQYEITLRQVKETTDKYSGVGKADAVAYAKALAPDLDWDELPGHVEVVKVEKVEKKK